MKIAMSPVSRISGLLSIDLFADSIGLVTEANVDGEQFRGFEIMLRGRQISDSVYFTQRICGICSMAHGYTAARLTEQLCNLTPPPEAALLQQAMLGAEFLQNHIRHFYLLALPDYLDPEARIAPSLIPVPPRDTAPGNSRLSPARQQTYREHTFAAMAASRKCHEMLAVFGGKIPHQHGLIAGGVTTSPDADRRKQFIALLDQVSAFIDRILLPDVCYLMEAFPEYIPIGAGPGRFLSFGLFDPSLGGHFPAGVWMTDGRRARLEPFHPEAIREDASFAWYEKDKPDPVKPGAYSWVKAARYQGMACEGGPLARKIIRNHLAGNRVAGPLGVMARLEARAAEAALIAGWMKEWIEQLPQSDRFVTAPAGPLGPPVMKDAVQTNDAPRGPLFHAAAVDGTKIETYRIITPSTWNFSPKDREGGRGPAESALIGCRATPDNLTEPGRIIRSFDPCLSCATHLMDQHGATKMTVQISV